MWVIGGTNNVNSFASDVWYSGDGGSWKRATANAPFGGRYGSQVLSYNGKIWLIAGNSNCTFMNDVWNSSDGVSWSLVTPAAAFSPREDFGAVVFDDGSGPKMWVIGGWPGPNKNDVWNSSDGITWNQVTANSGIPPRWGFDLVVYNNALWALGGAYGGLPTTLTCSPNAPVSAYSDIWTSNNGVGWVQILATEPFTTTYYLQSVTNNNEIWTTGGYYLSACCSSAQNGIYHTKNGINWTSVPNSPFVNRFYHLSLSYRNQVWVIGGCSYQNQGVSTVPVYLNDVWRSP